MKQMKLDIPVRVKKTGNDLNIQRKFKKGDTRRKKISKKEGEEVKKTSLNIFDCFCEKNKQVSPGAKMESASPGARMESASPGASMEGINPGTSMEVVVEEAQKEREEKEERLRRMIVRKNSWLNKMMVKEMVLELIDSTRTQAMMGTCVKVMEEILREAVMRAEVRTFLENLESEDRMEARVLQELMRNEVKRKKEARLAKKLEMESRWLTKRKEEDAQKVVEASRELQR